MIAFPLVALAIHLAAIAALAPGVGLEADQLVWLTAAQFPLMALSASVHGVAKRSERERLERIAFIAFGIGVTVPVLVMFVRYGIKIGPADPYGAPETASSSTAVLWYLGFVAIASVGNTMFIARPIIHIAGVMLASFRRIAARFAFAVIIGAVFGAAFGWFLGSDIGAELMGSVREVSESNPAPIVVGGVVIAAILGMTKHAVVPRD